MVGRWFREFNEISLSPLSKNVTFSRWVHQFCAGNTFAGLETGRVRCAKILDVPHSSKWLAKTTIEGMTLYLL